MVSKKTTRSPKTAAPAPTPVSDPSAAVRAPRRARSTPPKAPAPMPAAEPAEARAAAPAPAASGRATKVAAPKRTAPGTATRKSPARAAAAPQPAAPQPAVTAAAPTAHRSTAVAIVGAAEGTGSAPRVVTDEDIRVRAYFLSIEHRGQGSPEYFWLLAERELRRPGNSQ